MLDVYANKNINSLCTVRCNQQRKFYILKDLRLDKENKLLIIQFIHYYYFQKLFNN